MADRPTSTESFPQLRETPEEIAYELRSHEGALWTGSRMLIGIWAFAFAALGFAYFYLRSANNASLWRPAHVTAPTGVGAAVFAFSLASAFLVAYGLGRFRSGRGARLASRRMDRGALHAHCRCTANLAAHRAALFSGIQRVCVLLCRLGRDEHRAVAKRGILA